jgi:hypothetical protein
MIVEGGQNGFRKGEMPIKIAAPDMARLFLLAE